MRNFAPSQVELGGMFVGTFEHLEAECTAAVMVKVLAMNGDVWRRAAFSELADGFTKLTAEDGFWRSWFNNPFVNVDMHDLVKRGFAEFEDSGIKFTEAGLLRMEKWVAPTSAEVAI